VVIAIIVILATMLVPTLSRIISHGYRASCANNVRELARACVVYAQDARVNRRGTAGALPSAGPTTANWWNLTNGNPASLWLLLDYRYASAGSFLCPEAEVRRDFGIPSLPNRSAAGRLPVNFAAGTYSYSYLSQVPFTEGTAPNVQNYSATAISEASAALVIVADANPRCTPGQSGIIMPNPQVNSLNHNRVGQNVGRLDISVLWITDVGVQAFGEDVYAASLPEGVTDDSDGMRRALNDAFLLP